MKEAESQSAARGARPGWNVVEVGLQRRGSSRCWLGGRGGGRAGGRRAEGRGRAARRDGSERRIDLGIQAGGVGSRLRWRVSLTGAGKPVSGEEDGMSSGLTSRAARREGGAQSWPGSRVQARPAGLVGAPRSPKWKDRLPPGTRRAADPVFLTSRLRRRGSGGWIERRAQK